MNLKEVMMADSRKEGVLEEIQLWLRKIPRFAKVKEGEDIPLQDIENVVTAITKKYGVYMQHISFTILDGEIPWYTISLCDKRNGNVMIQMCHGLHFYEAISKACLYMFAYTRRIH